MQYTWGILQTLLGFVVFLMHFKLILGPLYLIVIGIPSTLWGFLGGKKRRDKQVPYGAFFTEKWAYQLGEQVTGEESIGDLVLD